MSDTQGGRAAERVRGVEALDPQTVEITLSHASPGFEDQPLSDMPILPRQLWEGLPQGTAVPEGLPVGSGPYRLVEHRRATGYRFAANRGYFLGRPTVEAIDVPSSKASTARYEPSKPGGST